MQNRNPPGDLQRQVFLKKRVESDIQTKIEDKFNCEVTFRDTPGLHPHPILAAERSLVLDEFTNIFDRNHNDGMIIDCFGNASEFNRRRMNNVWSAMPRMTTSDTTRVLSATTAGLTNWCEHLPNECRCVVAEVALYVQSAQYCKPSEIAIKISQVESHCAYSIMHNYDKIAGNFYKDEMIYFRSKVDEVTCCMDGGTTVYKHSACDWTQDRVLTRQGVLISELLCSVGSTHLYRHTLCAFNPLIDSLGPQEVKEWNPATVESGESGLFALPQTFVGNSKLSQKLQFYNMPIRRLMVCGGVIVVLDKGSEDIVMSKDILAETRTYLLSRPRNAALYHQLIIKITGLYHGVPNLPPDRMPRAILGTAILALASTSVETSALVDLLYDQRAMFSVYNDLVSFTEPVSIDWKTIKVMVASTSASIAAEIAWPTTMSVSTGPVGHSTALLALQHLHALNSAVVVGSAGVSVSALGLTASFAWVPVIISATSMYYTCKWLVDLTKKHENQRLVEEWSRVVPGEIPITEAKQIVFESPPKMNATKRMKPINADTTTPIIRTVDHRPQPTKPLMSLEGIGFSTVTPTYYASDQESLLSGVSNRLLAKTPTPIQGLWRKCALAYNKTPAQLDYLGGGTIYCNERALNDWIKRYPLHRQAELKRAYETLVAQNFRLLGNQMNVKLFTKTEKQIAVGYTDGEVSGEFHKLKAPRVITAMDDVAAALLGTVANCASTQRNRAIKLNFYQYIAPRAVSGEALGAWVDRSIAAMGGDGVIVVDADGTAFDCHTQTEAMDAARTMIYEFKRFDNPIVKDFKMKHRFVKGQGKGVKISLRDQRLTGEADTDLCNTVLSECLLCYCLERGSELWRRGKEESNDISFDGFGKFYRIAACGDDQFAIVNQQWFEERFDCEAGTYQERRAIQSAEFAANAYALGYTHTLNVGTINDREYCSKVFYPTPDGRLPGGKIGRVLSRSGYFLDILGEMTVAQTAESQLVDNYHVPFLREYFQRMQFICSKKKLVKKGKSHEHAIHMSTKHDYDESTMEFIYARYGLTQQDLDEFKTLLNSVEEIPVVIAWEPLGRLLSIDDA